MRSLHLTVMLGWVVTMAGCSGERPPSVGLFELDGFRSSDASENDLGLRTFDVRPIDVPARDTPPVDVPVAVGMNCVADQDCASGAVCLRGLCALDTCRTEIDPCGASSRCQLRCVPTRDLCGGVVCGGRETCFLGRCVAGCFPAPCSGVNCPAGQFCDDTTGACSPIRPCAARCGADYACHADCLPRSNCDGVTCAANQICADGRCVANPCAGVSCAAGSLCVSGTCVDTCHCDPPCERSARDRCVVGQCQCTRTCAERGACGADDGCGGRCVGTCEDRNATCNPETRACDCAPFCAETAPCGSSDGCGGLCASGCSNGQRCDTATRQCVCVPHCPAVEDFGRTPCGMTVANLCAGQPSCGTGTMCPGERRCGVSGRCEPETDMDAGMEDAAPSEGGVPGDDGACPAGRTRCGETCANLQISDAHCGACDAPCPFGATCRAGVCTCEGSLRLCGTRCVNVDSDQGHCGSCGTACPALSECTGGRCVCVPRCVTDPSLVACGTDVPNECPGGPSCGQGRRCAAGSLCDTAMRRCVCVPLCLMGVRCGVTDGCGGTCIGTCGPGETCARDPMDATRYFCSSAGCVGGCACNQVCSMNRCVDVTCPNGSSACPCQCCPLGQRCVGGSACMSIPP